MLLPLLRELLKMIQVDAIFLDIYFVLAFKYWVYDYVSHYILDFTLLFILSVYNQTMYVLL